MLAGLAIVWYILVLGLIVLALIYYLLLVRLFYLIEADLSLLSYEFLILSLYGDPKSLCGDEGGTELQLLLCFIDFYDYLD